MCDSVRLLLFSSSSSFRRSFPLASRWSVCMCAVCLCERPLALPVTFLTSHASVCSVACVAVSPPPSQYISQDILIYRNGWSVVRHFGSVVRLVYDTTPRVRLDSCTCGTTFYTVESYGTTHLWRGVVHVPLLTYMSHMLHAYVTPHLIECVFLMCANSTHYTI